MIGSDGVEGYFSGAEASIAPVIEPQENWGGIDCKKCGAIRASG
jgi:hypothetical protein